LNWVRIGVRPNLARLIRFLDLTENQRELEPEDETDDDWRTTIL